ncbi:hypothetical protein SASPL_141332 [Salvia splendens]|uniref:Bulb-type lectin domain-containing protein n=1 Tax=Salvia splendens TaxID=180675 RepID=A0A8X8WRN6_SALSN|nr:hypothetical protein SASPL_141332 [Salvia splendens]
MAPKFEHIVIHKSILLLIIIQSVACLSMETDTISTGVVIKDPQTITSQKQIYKLGFFKPPNTTNRYLGIFFTFSQETVIWVANRNKPLKDSSGSVTLSRDGNLVVLDGTNQTVWSTNLTTTSPVSLIVQIVDTGNLILLEEATEDVLWESFSQPTDVLVQGMTLSQIGALIVSRIFPLEICMAWSVGLLLHFWTVLGGAAYLLPSDFDVDMDANPGQIIKTVSELALDDKMPTRRSTSHNVVPMLSWKDVLLRGKQGPGNVNKLGVVPASALELREGVGKLGNHHQQAMVIELKDVDMDANPGQIIKTVSELALDDKMPTRRSTSHKDVLLRGKQGLGNVLTTRESVAG